MFTDYQKNILNLFRFPRAELYTEINFLSKLYNKPVKKVTEDAWEFAFYLRDDLELANQVLLAFKKYHGG